MKNVANTIEAIRNLQPSSKTLQEEEFANYFDAIRDAIDRKVSRKKIIETLAEAGLKLHPVKFKQLFEKLAAVRQQDAKETDHVE